MEEKENINKETILNTKENINPSSEEENKISDEEITISENDQNLNANNSEIETNGYYEPITFISPDDIYEGINDARKEFSAAYNKVRKGNLLLTIPIFVVAVLGFILSSLHTSILIITLVLVIVGFVFVFRKTKTNREKLNSMVQDTITKYFVNLDTYITANEHFSEVKFNSLHKLDEKLFDSLHIIKDIYHVGGRDKIVGKLDGINFYGGDYLVKTREEKDDKIQDYIVFLGKLFVFDLPVVKAGRAIIYLKGKGANGPTDIDDVEKIEGVLSEKYDVYASCNINSVLTEDVKAVLEQFETNETLIDMFITIDTEQVSVGLSYSDGVMRVPLFEELKRDDIEQYKSDSEKMVSFILGLKK